MAYISLFQNEKWWSHSAYSYGYISMEYSHWREGTNQCYQINYSAGVSSGAYYSNGIDIYVILDGVTYQIGDNVGTNNSSSWYQEGTGWYSIANKTSGTTSFYAAVYDAKTGALLWAGGTTNLNVDNAYPTVITNPYITGRTINTLSFNIGAVNIASNVYYSLDNSNWTHATSENVKISNLTAGTTYTIYVQYRNTADSSLTTTATCQGTTLPQALISSPGQGFTLNSNSGITIKCTNNSGCPVQYYLETYINGVSTAFGLTSSTTATSYTFSADVVKTMLSKIPSANSCTVRAVVATVINGNRAYYSFTSGTLKVVNSNPTFSNWSYEDINSKTLALTGDNQIVVKGYSSVKGIVTTANKATANNYASMSKYRLTIGSTSKEATYSGSADVETEGITASTNSFTMYAIDSRSNSTAVTKTASTYKEYFNIAIDTSKTYIQRQNNGIGSNATLNVEGKIWNGNFGAVTNSIKSFEVFYKLTTESEYTAITVENPTITDNTFQVNASIEGDLGADGFTITSAFHIQVKVIDKLSSSTYTMTLSSGTPNLAVHPEGVAINKPYDTDIGGALQVNGDINNATNMPVAKSYNSILNTTFNDVDEEKAFYRSGLYTTYIDGAWYNLINVRHRNGLDDGINYGLQIRNALTDKTNRLYVRSQYGGANTWSDWEPIYTAKSLYDNTSGTTGTVTLSESAANFIYLEIYAKNSQGYTSQKVYTPNGKTVGLMFALHATESNYNLVQYVTKRVTISGTSITTTSYRVNNNRADGTVWVGNENSLAICKVVGYR